jgi:hypothetical protein
MPALSRRRAALGLLAAGLAAGASRPASAAVSATPRGTEAALSELRDAVARAAALLRQELQAQLWQAGRLAQAAARGELGERAPRLDASAAMVHARLDGRIAFAAGTPAEGRVAARPWFRAGLGGAVLADADGTAPHALFNLSAPVTDRDGATTGVVMLEVTRARIAGVLAEIGAALGSEAMLLGRDGAMLAGAEGRRPGPLAAAAARQGVARAMMEEGPDGQRLLAAVAPLELPEGLSGIGGSLMLRRPAAAMAAAAEAAPSMLAALAGSAVLLAGIVALVGRRTRRPDVAAAAAAPAADAAEPVSLADALRDLRSRQANRAAAGREIAA